MTTAIIVGALTVIAAQTAALLYLVRLLSKAQSDSKANYDSHIAEIHTNTDLQKRLGETLRALDDTRKVLADKEDEVTRVRAARTTAERQRDAFLAELAKGGDPAVIAAGINAELAALGKLK